MSGQNTNMPADWPAELKLLVHFTRERNDAALATAMSDIPVDMDWSTFMALANHHRVESILADNISTFPEANIPADVREHYTAMLRKKSMGAMTITRAAIEMIKALGEDDIRCVLLKGHSVSSRFYQVPHTRESIDVDILVDWKNITRSRAAVEKLGFQQYFPDVPVPLNRHDMLRTLACDIAYIRPSDGVQLDLHWRLNRNSHLLEWDFDVVLGLTETMLLANEKVKVIKPAAQINYMICHGARHAWFRLKWLADIYRILEVLTPAQLAEMEKLSSQYGTRSILGTGLQLVQEVYGFPPALQAKIKGLNIPLNPVHIPYLTQKVAQSSYHKNFRIRDIGDVLKSFRYLFGLRKDKAYKKFVIVDLLVNIRDVKTLGLSRKWLWVYVILSPFLRIANMSMKALKR